ncbi:hypothetical protein CsSME_00016634 [Camellia sinensis var. sinensis]
MGLEELPVNRWCIEQGSVLFSAARSLLRCRSPLQSRILMASPVVGRDRLARFFCALGPLGCVVCVCGGALDDMKERKRCEGILVNLPVEGFLSNPSKRVLSHVAT